MQGDAVVVPVARLIAAPLMFGLLLGIVFYLILAVLFWVGGRRAKR